MKKKFLRQNYSLDIRRKIFLTFLFLFCLLIIFRLFNLQVLEYKFYSALASGQHQILENLFPERGEIFIHTSLPKEERENKPLLFPLATNKEYFVVYAEPFKIKEPEKIAKILAPLLEKDEEEILKRLSKKDDPYEPLASKVEKEKVKEIESLDVLGIGFKRKVFRYYPENNIGGHLTGFLGYRGHQQIGQYGIEGYFDRELRGKKGYIRGEKDLLGRWIIFGQKEFREAEDGADLILTIDKNIEEFICQVIKEAVEKHQAEEGTIIVQNPKTGAILGMCSFPDFNPNEYFKVKEINLFNNPAIFKAYEPGSVFKAFTLASALEEGKITPETTYIYKGFVKFGDHIIKNWDEKAHYKQTMIQVLEKSLNTGAIFVEQLLGKEKFREYIQKFGFGEKTGIELETEVKGNIESLQKRGEIYGATASFGQGITATPIQLITAFSALANGGYLLRPYIVEEIVNSNGESIKTQPQVIRQVISEKTSIIITGMLTSVVEKGHGQKAKIPGYFVAGKTGTAQVPKEGGKGYEKDLTIGTFIGYTPISDTQFTIFVKIDKPKTTRFAEATTAPVFAEVGEFLLKYFEIPPERK